MQRCKCCRKDYPAEYRSEDGVEIEERGVMSMGYGSKHDGNLYKFTLLPGWYCWACLDKEVDCGLCQPLVVYSRGKSGAMDSLRVKRYPVKGYEKEAAEYRCFLWEGR